MYDNVLSKRGSMFRNIILLICLICSSYLFSCSDEGIYNRQFDYDKFDKAYIKRNFDEMKSCFDTLEPGLVWSLKTSSNPFYTSIKNRDMEMLEFLFVNNILKYSEIGDMHSSLFIKPLENLDTELLEYLFTNIPLSTRTQHAYKGLLYSTIKSDELLVYTKKLVDIGVEFINGTIISKTQEYAGATYSINLRTPLVEAVEQNQYNTVKYLLESGAKPNILTYKTRPYVTFMAISRKYALDYATDDSIKKLLLKHNGSSISDMLKNNSIDDFKNWDYVTCTISTADKPLYNSLDESEPFSTIKKDEKVYILNFSSLTYLEDQEVFVYIVTDRNTRGMVSIDKLWSIDITRRGNAK